MNTRYCRQQLNHFCFFVFTFSRSNFRFDHNTETYSIVYYNNTVYAQHIWDCLTPASVTTPCTRFFSSLATVFGCDFVFICICSKTPERIKPADETSGVNRIVMTMISHSVETKKYDRRRRRRVDRRGSRPKQTLKDVIISRTVTGYNTYINVRMLRRAYVYSWFVGEHLPAPIKSKCPRERLSECRKTVRLFARYKCATAGIWLININCLDSWFGIGEIWFPTHRPRSLRSARTYLLIRYRGSRIIVLAASCFHRSKKGKDRKKMRIRPILTRQRF